MSKSNYTRREFLRWGGLGAGAIGGTVGGMIGGNTLVDNFMNADVPESADKRDYRGTTATKGLVRLTPVFGGGTAGGYGGWRLAHAVAMRVMPDEDNDKPSITGNSTG